MASQLENLSTFGNWNLPLRIQRRGNFFSDEGFQDYRRYFESAAKDLLQEFDLHRNEDAFRSYRRLRDHQLSGTDRAAKIAEESDKYKIVMDVEGFTNGDLQVKVSGPNEIVVEGHQEISNGGASSLRSFKRRFSLPGLALVQDASSVLSSDNVLTVNIPKKVQEITDKSEQTSFTVKQQTDQFKNLESKIQESIQKAKETASSFMSDNLKTSSLATDNICDLQIIPRESFFDDSFFENVRQNFQKSVEEMMEKRRRRITSVGDVGIVKKVRETKGENVQATSVTEDTKDYKIVLDVHGFSEGDLKVRAVSENELVVEGKVEKRTEHTSCSHTFKRKFALPPSVNIRQSSSAVSSEGILTITVPKRTESIDYAIPVRTEAASHLSNILKKEQEKEENVLSSKQTVQQQSKLSSTSTASTNTTSATRVSDSQNLLDKIQKTVETERKLCEGHEKQEHFVPINLEETQTMNITEERKDTTKQVVNEPTSLIKQSQKLVSESAKLMEELDLEATERDATKEHFVPVELDAGTTVTMNTQKSKVTQQSNVTENVSSPTDTSKSSVQHKTLDTNKYHPPSSRIIPISLKGSVYDESIFDDARKSIEKEVQDVFTKYRKSSADEHKETSEVQTSVQDSSSLIKNGQTTSTIVEDTHCYKIVIDVFGFEENELNVKVSGVNEISIEGNSEKSKEGSISKHSFQRTFQLPEYIDLEKTSTALSKEGILTVTVPKKNQLLSLGKGVSPATSKLNKELNKSTEIKTLVVDSAGVVQDDRSERSSVSDISENLSQTTSDMTTSQNISSGPVSPQSIQSTQSTQSAEHRREYVVPVSVEDTSDIVSEAGSVYSTSNLTSQTSTVSDTSRDVGQDILSTSTSASSIDTQIHSKSNVPDSAKVIQIGLDTTADNKMATSSTLTDQTRDIRSTFLFNLPIVSKGYFFDDSFFQDSRSMFESILRNKMNRFNKSTSFIDDLGFFKSLREKRITGGNQMATLSEDDHFNKIVLDVQGFSENNLKVKVMSENEILIEGEVQEKSGNSTSKKTFRKYFLLPGSVDLKGATSALSSDGVLNIKIPKKL